MIIMFKKQTKLNYTLDNPLSFRKDDEGKEPTEAYDLGTDTVVPSTAIQSARYDGEDMHIRFKNGNGTEYTYPDVPPEVAKKFSMATSYGKAFNQDIKPYSINA